MILVLTRVLTLTLAISGSMYADRYLEFTGSGGSPFDMSGSVSFAGGTAPIVGSAPIQGLALREGDGIVSQFICSNCMLNFQTGPVLSYYAGTPSPWNLGGTFDAGGQITITGSMVGFGTSSPLLTGLFTAPIDFFQSAHFFEIADFFSRSSFTLDAGLAQALGVAASGTGELVFTLYNSGFTTIPYVSLGGPGVSIVVNPTPAANPTPEPLSPALLGTALVGFAVLKRLHLCADRGSKWTCAPQKFPPAPKSRLGNVL